MCLENEIDFCHQITIKIMNSFFLYGGEWKEEELFSCMKIMDITKNMNI